MPLVGEQGAAATTPLSPAPLERVRGLVPAEQAALAEHHVQHLCQLLGHQVPLTPNARTDRPQGLLGCRMQHGLTQPC